MWDSLTRTLLVLTFVTGIVDAVSFLALGHVFAAMQTGNAIFLGLGIGGSAGIEVLAPLLGLVAYLFGSAAASVLIRDGGASPAVMTVAMLAEAGLLGAAAVVAAVAEVTAGEGVAYLLICVLSTAMGLRNTIARTVGDPALATTVLTLTFSALASPTPLGFVSGVEIGVRAASVLAIVAGAAAGALLLEGSAGLAIGVAAAVVLLTSLAHGRAVATRTA